MFVWLLFYLLDFSYADSRKDRLALRIYDTIQYDRRV